MALGITTLARRAARARAKSLAARVAGNLLDRATSAAQRLVEFAEAVRPALEPHLSADAREIEVVPSAPRPSPKRRAPEPSVPPTLPHRELEAWHLARHVREGLDGRRRAIFEVKPFASASPDQHDVDVVHDMRVASRRLRAFVELFGPRLPDKLRIRLRRGLRAITRGLGPLREWDVFWEELQRRRGRARDPLQQAALEHVLEWVERRRLRARRRAAHALEGVDWARLERDLEEAGDRVVGPWIRPDLELGENIWTVLGPRIDAAFDGAPIPESLADEEAVHEVRVQMKRLRYAFELVEPALGKRGKPMRRPLKQVQRAIGTARDLALLRDLLKRRVARLDANDRPALGEGLAAIVRDVEAQWHRAQAAIDPALRSLDRAALLERARDGLGVAPPVAEAAQ